MTSLGVVTTPICSRASKDASKYASCQSNNELCNYQEQQYTAKGFHCFSGVGVPIIMVVSRHLSASRSAVNSEIEKYQALQVSTKHYEKQGL